VIGRNYHVYRPTHCVLQVPSCEIEWLEVARDFNDKWQLPNCVGAIDGKHIEIVKPAHSGSTYINYKGYFSIVLLAVVDADYKFLYVDVGAQGRISDGGVFAHSSLSQALESNTINLPKPAKLPNGSEEQVPFYIIGDDAFPLKTYLMKPYSRRDLSSEERIANYRFSRARRVSENAFGIMSNVFRVLHTPMLLSPNKAELVVLAICTLHNFLRTRAPSAYATRFVEEQESECHQLTDICPTYQRNATTEAKQIRDILKQYVVGVGQVPWQDVYTDKF